MNELTPSPSSLELLYATSNAGKIVAMRKHLSSTTINFIGLDEVDAALPVVDEYGNNPLDNARIKAKAYYDVLKRPLFSLDSGLYIDGLPEELQPGVHVRHVNGHYLDDEAMIAYYSSLARSIGSPLKARYQNAICLILNENLIFEHFDLDIAGKYFYITEEAHPRRVKGFPIDSLSVDIATGQYFFDLGDVIERSDMDKGFTSFFLKALHHAGLVTEDKKI